MSQTMIEDPKLLAFIFVVITIFIMISHPDQSKRLHHLKAAPLTPQQSLSLKIQEIITSGEEKVATLVQDYPNQIERFIEKYPQPQLDNAAYVAEKQGLEDLHTKIGELLLSTLLRLDELELPADFPNLRQERRAGIQELQSLISTVDKVWAKVAE